MQISVSGRHLSLSKDTQEYARNKASKLRHFLDKIQMVDIIVAKEGGNYVVEIIVKPDHRESFVGSDSGSDVQACIDLSVDKVGRQITRYKEKIRSRKRQAGPTEV